MEINGKIYGTVCSRKGSIVECGKIIITKFDENSSGSKCEPDRGVEK